MQREKEISLSGFALIASAAGLVMLLAIIHSYINKYPEKPTLENNNEQQLQKLLKQCEDEERYEECALIAQAINKLKHKSIHA